MALDDCRVCKEKLPVNGDYAKCSLCNGGLHLDPKCSGVKRSSWKSMGAASQDSWVCPPCRKSRMVSQTNEDDGNGSNNEDTRDLEDQELTSLSVQRDIQAKVTALMGVKDKIDSIESSMKFFSEKYDQLLAEVTELRSENKTLKKELEAVKSAESNTRIRTNQLTTDLAELEQYGRRVNLEIQGLPVKGQPREEDICKVLEEVATDIGMDFRPSEIHNAHRLQPRNNGKPPTVIVQFHSKVVRDRWLQKGRKAKIIRDNSKVYFNENLCPKYRLLLKEAKLRAGTHKYDFVWFSGGRVLVKKNENSENVVVIKSMDDLHKIK